MSTPHNPANLSPGQVNPPLNPYRLLDEDEVGPQFEGVRIHCIEAWYSHSWGRPGSGNSGSYVDWTYRTRLTREELAKARRAAK